MALETNKASWSFSALDKSGGRGSEIIKADVVKDPYGYGQEISCCVVRQGQKGNKTIVDILETVSALLILMVCYVESVGIR